jgi:crotonobetainyl-CoA:carnitine CoA-transferase CaiB-like acyl-CoA transferase
MRTSTMAASTPPELAPTLTSELRPPGPAGPGALAGLRVVDMSRVMAGNMLTLQLADMGADVIKIEAPGTPGDPLRAWRTRGVPVWWRTYSRNKRSLAVDLRSEDGMELLRRLIVSAQVLVENFRPGTLEKMGLSPEVLHALQPGLVIARISGWGQTGPWADKPGFGSLVEAYSGLAGKTGYEDRPPVLPSMTLADMVTGLYGFGAVLAAVRHVEHSGQGQVIDLSLFDAMLGVVGPDAADAALTGRIPPRMGSRSPTAAPRNVYRTSDGFWVALSSTTQPMTERLFRAIGRPDMIDDPRFHDNSARVRHMDPLDEAVQDFIGARTRQEVLRHFEEHEVTVGALMDASELLQDDFVRERASLVAMDDPDTGVLPMHNVVPRLSVTPGGLRRSAPEVGADTGDILRELGLPGTEIERLIRTGVVAVQDEGASSSSAPTSSMPR